MCKVPEVRKDLEAWHFLGTETGRKPQWMEQGEQERVPRTAVHEGLRILVQIKGKSLGD